MNNHDKGKVIFEENRPTYKPAAQRRYWIIIIVLFSFHLAFLFFSVAQGILYWSDKTLLIEKFNFLLKAVETVLSLISVILFFRKATLGWILAATSITFRTTEFLAITIFSLYRSFSLFGLEVMALFVAYVMLLYLIYKQDVQSMFRVRPTAARSALLIGAVIALAVFAFEMAEPYWRLHNSNCSA